MTIAITYHVVYRCDGQQPGCAREVVGYSHRVPEGWRTELNEKEGKLEHLCPVCSEKPQ